MKRQHLVSIGAGALITALAFSPLALSSPAGATSQGPRTGTASVVAQR